MQRCCPDLFRHLLRAAAGAPVQATEVCHPVRMPCGGAPAGALTWGVTVLFLPMP